MDHSIVVKGLSGPWQEWEAGQRVGNRTDKRWCYSTKTVHLPRHPLPGSVISFTCAGEEKLSCELIPKSILLVDFQYKAVLAFCYCNETPDTGNLQNRVVFQLIVGVDSSPRWTHGFSAYSLGRFKSKIRWAHDLWLSEQKAMVWTLVRMSCHVSNQKQNDG